MPNNVNDTIRWIKRRIRKLEGLAGTLVVTAADRIVTVQRADREKQRRQLRKK